MVQNPYKRLLERLNARATVESGGQKTRDLKDMREGVDGDILPRLYYCDVELSNDIFENGNDRVDLLVKHCMPRLETCTHLGDNKLHL